MKYVPEGEFDGLLQRGGPACPAQASQYDERGPRAFVKLVQVNVPLQFGHLFKKEFKANNAINQ